MVTTVVNDPGLAVGDVLDWTGAETFSCLVPTGALSKGDVLCRDTGGSPDYYSKKTATANLAGPFVMVLADKAAGVLHASVIKGGTWAVRADGTINFGAPVGMSPSTDGQVVELAAGDVTATPTEATIEAAIAIISQRVGTCEGFADSYKTGNQVAAVDGDLVAVNANSGY